MPRVQKPGSDFDGQTPLDSHSCQTKMQTPLKTNTSTDLFTLAQIGAISPFGRSKAQTSGNLSK